MKKLIATILLICSLPLLMGAAEAEYSPNIDFMARMEVAAVAGATAVGQAYEINRNDKIDMLGLTCSKIYYNDLYLLAKIIYAEAGSQWLSDDWKMSVGEVALNRVASSEFPNTLEEVIHQPGQYYGSQSRYFENLRPDFRCVVLAKRLLSGERVLNDASVVFQANFTQGGGTHTALYDKYLGWTYFCYSSRPELYGEG